MTLTARQLEIAELLYLGHSQKRIATRLRLSFHTVRTQIYRIAARIGGTGSPQTRIVRYYGRHHDKELNDG